MSQRGPQAAGSCGHGLRPGLLPSRGTRAHIPGEPAAVRTLPGGHLPAHLRAGHHHSRSQVPRGGESFPVSLSSSGWVLGPENYRLHSSED